MCGIAGIVGAGDWLGTVEAMTETLRHRGPDGGGTWSVPGVALGHRRLAIVDLSPAGHQPMHFGDCTIVYNGEIYNFRELRRELDGPFHSDSDTEVILHLYAKYGPACLERLAGMFAFAIWDERKRELFVARDRLGIKPFFYLQRQGMFAFASELKALAGLSSRRIDHTALWDYFSYKYIPCPKTIYEDVRQLPPGARDGRERRRYPVLALLVAGAEFRGNGPRPRAAAARGAAARGRAGAHDRRRADRRVPLGRHRFDGRRRQPRPAAHVCHRLRRPEDRRGALCASRRRAFRHRTSRATGAVARSRGGARAPADDVRRALRGRRGVVQLRRLARGAAFRHGGALGRGRRRSLLGLPAPREVAEVPAQCGGDGRFRTVCRHSPSSASPPCGARRRESSSTGR